MSQQEPDPLKMIIQANDKDGTLLRCAVYSMGVKPENPERMNLIVRVGGTVNDVITFTVVAAYVKRLVLFTGNRALVSENVLMHSIKKSYGDKILLDVTTKNCRIVNLSEADTMEIQEQKALA